MRTLYFDCFSGAGGDMIVASLIDAGASFAELECALSGLGLSGYRVSAEKVRKQGFAATRFNVEVDPGKQPHRHLRDIVAILEKANLSDGVRNRAIAVFERLADAEAEAHGTSRDKVHFHEVGAVDAIVDIVAAMIALELLAPERIVCSPLVTGSGTVTCEHGVMPVPAPATAILLKGVPLVESAERGELLTPTAAAILTTVANSFGPKPAMAIEQIGLGAGTRETATLPNVCRVMLGTATGEGGGESVVVLETNLDDASGEWLGRCMERLLGAGALDVYFQPIYMKKCRPGVLLTVLCEHADAAMCETIVFEETSTFGMRRRVCGRVTLDRRTETVQTPYGDVRIKVGLRDGRTMSASAEYEDCVKAAERHGVAVKQVMSIAIESWRSGGRSVGA